MRERTVQWRRRKIMMVRQMARVIMMSMVVKNPILVKNINEYDYQHHWEVI